MKVDIKPQIVCARDYHEFDQYEDDDFMNTGVKMNYEEIGWTFGTYYAVIWLDGDERNLFNFLMTNELALEILNQEED